MSGLSFWGALKFRRPSSSTSTSDTSISSSRSSSFRSRFGRKKDSFYDFDYAFDSSSESMNVNTQEPTKEVHGTNKDTGFSEPWSRDRNTTLAHPDADTSKNATLESTEDDMIHRTHSRLYRHRFHSKHKSNLLTVPYDNIEYADGSHENNDARTIGKEGEKGSDLPNPPNETPKTVEEYVEIEDRDAQGYAPGDRRKGVLRKMNLHKV